MPILNLESIAEQHGSRYPQEHAGPCAKRRFRRLGTAGGLTHLGVTRLVLEPGVWSSQRHFHPTTDEFLAVLEGEVILVDDDGEHPMRAGDCAAFPAGDGNGHHVLNRSGAPAVLLTSSSMSPQDGTTYPDIDMKADVDPATGKSAYLHKDGRPY